MIIRPFAGPDAEAVWNMLHDTFRKGDTYAIDPGISQTDAMALWVDAAQATFVCEVDGVVLGTYYIKTNKPGGGAHVCNCGYVTAAAAQGQGLASAMCVHSQDQAREMLYKAMQFNFVLCTNHGAIRLWERAGFETVGRIPRAFDHPGAGLTDALVMFKWLAD